MILTVFNLDKTQIRVNLDSRFATNMKNGRVIKLTKYEIERKAETNALEISKDKYLYHTIEGIDEDMKEIRELKC